MIQANDQKENVLGPDEGNLDVSTTLSTVKINFLIQQKFNLDIQLNECKQNNKLLRSINSQIIKEEMVDLGQILKRNQELEKALSYFTNQNKQLRTELFLCKQVTVENQKESKQIFQNYEQKILQLRRNIQGKQSIIQLYQQKMKLQQQYSPIYATPYTINIQFHNQVQELKGNLNKANTLNKKLMFQTQKLREENQKQSQQMELIKNLITSKCLYLDYKNIMNKRSLKSVPRNQTFYRNKIQKSQKKDKQASSIDNKNVSTIQMTNYRKYENNSLSNNSSIKIIKKKMKQILNLEEKIRNLQKKQKNNQTQIQKLIQSNKIYEKSRRNVDQKSNLYQVVNQHLINLIQQRNVCQDIRSTSLLFKQKKNTQKKIKSVRNTKIINKIEKQFWVNQSKKFNKKKQSIFTIQKKLRSRSCVFDFIGYKYFRIISENEEELSLQQSDFLNDKSIQGDDIKIQNPQKDEQPSIIMNSKKINSKKEKNIIKVQKQIFDDILQDL